VVQILPLAGHLMFPNLFGSKWWLVGSSLAQAKGWHPRQVAGVGQVVAELAVD
jgi:hypothetical protein